MKISLDLPQVPEGWRFLGIVPPKINQAVLIFDNLGNISFRELLREDQVFKFPSFTFERDIDEELEAAKKKFPVGSKVIYVKGPLKGEIRTVDNVRRKYSSGNHVRVMFTNRGFDSYTYLEPYVEDTELLDAQARFPVGSYVKHANYNSTLFKIENVVNAEFGLHVLIITEGELPNLDAKRCTPFPLPVWRCCANDRPKVSNHYPTRRKSNKRDYNVFRFYSDAHWLMPDPHNYEWLDEGTEGE